MKIANFLKSSSFLNAQKIILGANPASLIIIPCGKPGRSCVRFPAIKTFRPRMSESFVAGYLRALPEPSHERQRGQGDEDNGPRVAARPLVKVSTQI